MNQIKRDQGNARNVLETLSVTFSWHRESVSTGE